MKKTFIALSLFTTLVHADLFNDGVKAYENGNYKEAMRLYEKAALQGNTNAQYNLGVMYANGKGVRQDFTKALKWFQIAADHRDASAQYNLGIMYENGRGVRQNKSQAKEFYGQACDNGLQLGCEAYKDLNEKGF
ncbi:tetratricopeptide repeat protein [Sulfurimonas paralvinellae]|uniref:beta-lactamase n=1 Tax=Sulfurimonas paralvinellae TaxID=317658 RepID=A0A7M1B7K8_9BACT|nr:tetratricopeptide repeat protein [Sulfurimonas paralvinellae]QOP45693.1 sel1 repeat family protein [Sulfurimonas paralvinellae]